MSDPAPQSFYAERIPAQFNHTLEAQEAAGEAGARVLEDLRKVNATMRIIVEGEGGSTFNLNIAQGRMSADAEARHDPFLTIVHDLAAFEVLERESGDSALGFLGGLVGISHEIKLTHSRLANLAGLAGALRFSLTGEGGFTLLTHFGGGEVAAEPKCSISIDAEAYRALKSGELNPQDAFMNGKIAVEGDMQMAMQLALAAMSPD